MSRQLRLKQKRIEKRRKGISGGALRLIRLWQHKDITNSSSSEKSNNTAGQGPRKLEDLKINREKKIPRTSQSAHIKYSSKSIKTKVLHRVEHVKNISS
jgi:hypothetical protein